MKIKNKKVAIAGLVIFSVALGAEISPVAGFEMFGLGLIIGSFIN